MNWKHWAGIYLTIGAGFAAWEYFTSSNGPTIGSVAIDGLVWPVSLIALATGSGVP